MMEKWQQRLIRQAEVSLLDEGARAAQEQAEEVARRTRELLNSQGWCLWKCSTLGGDTIAVVRDENVEGVPDGYSVYTEAELEELCLGDVSEATLRLAYEAKKQIGVVVISVEDAKRGNHAS